MYDQGGTHCQYFKGKKIVSSSLQQELEGLLEELHDAACAGLGRKQHMKSLVKTKHRAAGSSLQQLMSGARLTMALG